MGKIYNWSFSSGTSLVLVISTLLLLHGSIVEGQGSKTESRIMCLDDNEISFAEIDRFISYQMEQLKMPALSLAVINNSKIVYQDFRMNDNFEQKSTGRIPIFEAASLSKPVFAYFVMKVVEEGNLDLDIPLHEYLPYPDISSDERYKKITARMVLQHSSGFPNWREDNEDGNLDLKFDPGRQFLYSGEGYHYLAKVIAKIYETDLSGLQELFHRLVTGPLGLSNFSFIESSDLLKNKLEPYVDGKVFDWKNDYWYKKEKGKFVAASSLLTNVTSYAKFLLAIMNQDGISKEIFQEMISSHSVLPNDHPLQMLGISKWCLGFYIFDSPFGPLYGHGGNNTGFHSLFNISIEKKWGYVFFTNCEKGTEFGMLLNEFLLTGNK